jgi:hypothetical protein
MGFSHAKAGVESDCSPLKLDGRGDWPANAPGVGGPRPTAGEMEDGGGTGVPVRSRLQVEPDGFLSGSLLPGQWANLPSPPGRQTRSLRCGGRRRCKMPRGGTSAAIRDGWTPRRRSARSPISWSRVRRTRDAVALFILGTMRHPQPQQAVQSTFHLCQKNSSRYFQRSLPRARYWQRHSP